MKRTVCDNCRQVLKTTTINCTDMSVDIIKMISEFTHKNITIPCALDILRGANTKGIRDAGHNQLSAYNSCSQLSKAGTSPSYEVKSRQFDSHCCRSRTIGLAADSRWILAAGDRHSSAAVVRMHGCLFTSGSQGTSGAVQSTELVDEPDRSNDTYGTIESNQRRET